MLGRNAGHVCLGGSLGGKKNLGGNKLGEAPRLPPGVQPVLTACQTAVGPQAPLHHAGVMLALYGFVRSEFKKSPGIAPLLQCAGLHAPSW